MLKNLNSVIDYCIKQVDKGLVDFDGQYAAAASVNSVYPKVGNDSDWNAGFWTGMQWLAYEFTRDEKYKDAALAQIKDYHYRIVNRIGVDHHDMGFLYLPSCVMAYKLTGDEFAKETALLAADNFAGRFQETGQFIQAWGKLGEKNNYRLIIDCLLNIPLLFWATEVTGMKRYREIAEAHLDTTMKVIIREDGSTFHTYFFDTQTGAPICGKTHQGASDDSIWARGQAWGVYGIALGYKHTGRQDLIEKFMQVTDVFLKHLPEDNIPAWDLSFTDTKTQKDTSSAAIAACGILEMSKLCKLPDEYLQKAVDMLQALCDSMLTSDIPESNGILKHAVYAMPDNIGVDECNIWGDYYFMEALMRLKNSEWISCWE